MNTTESLSVNDRFVMALEGLYAATAARFRDAGWTVAMIWAVCSRIRRIERRIVWMLARFQAGTLRVGAPRPAGGEGKAAVVAGSRAVRAGTGLPRRFAWLIPLVPCDAAAFASQLRVLLAEPEMVALLTAAPQARRVLAPMCRMLGIEASVLTPHRQGVAEALVSEVEKVAKLRVRKKRPPVDWGRIPLPRGVLSWARREGFGKV